MFERVPGGYPSIIICSPKSLALSYSSSRDPLRCRATWCDHRTTTINALIGACQTHTHTHAASAGGTRGTTSFATACRRGACPHQKRVLRLHVLGHLGANPTRDRQHPSSSPRVSAPTRSPPTLSIGKVKKSCVRQSDEGLVGWFLPLLWFVCKYSSTLPIVLFSWIRYRSALG